MTKKKLSEIIEILERPTPPAEVSWLPRGVKPKGNSTSEGVAIAIPYISSGYVENTLDEAAGKFGWQSDLKQVSGIMCMGVGIKDPETSEWLWRWDVGLEKSQDEHGSKSEVTGALKRAARQWGIGRDLKDYPKPRAACRIWKGNDSKFRFSSWIGNPGEVALRGTNITEPTKAEQSEPTPTGEATAASPAPTDPAPAAASSEEETVEMTPLQARTMIFRYAVNEVNYSEQAASKWIGDQEKGHGKTVEAYRLMYGLLMDIKKRNAPPEGWQPGQEVTEGSQEQEEVHA